MDNYCNKDSVQVKFVHIGYKETTRTFIC